MTDRVAFVVATDRGTGMAGGQGSLDRDAIQERFALPDAGFELVALASSEDLAGQLDERRAALGGRPSTLVFYASARAVAAGDAALLVLDADEPEQGDALTDVLDVLGDFQAQNLLILLDLRCDPGTEPLDLIALVRDAARPVQGVELIAGARVVARDHEADAQAPSPFTRAVLEALDGADPAEGLYAVELYEHIREDAALVSAAPALVYTATDDSAALLLITEEEAPSVEIEASPLPPEASPLPPEASPLPPEASPAPAEAQPLAAIPPPAGPPPKSLPPPEAHVEISMPPPSVPPASRPSQPPGARDVVAEADKLAAAGDLEEALARYRKALALFGAGSLRPSAEGAPRVSPVDAERARIYKKMGGLKLKQRLAREAIANFEKAISLDPGLESELSMYLHRLFRETGDLRALRAIEERILDRVKESDRASLLVGFGRAWLEDQGDLMRARETLEAALSISPGDRSALELLLRVARTDRRGEDVLNLRRRLAETDPDAVKGAAEFHEIAEELVKLKREDDALDLLEAALDGDPSRLEPLAKMSVILAERQEWSELEGVYQRMLERLPRVEDLALRHELEIELCRRLGLLLRDHLEDLDAAITALERALAVRPGDVALRHMVIELFETKRSAPDTHWQAEDADKLEAHLLAAAALEPGEPRAFHQLFELTMRAEQVERACDIAGVLVELGLQGDRERAVFESNKPDGTQRIVGALDAPAWALMRKGSHPADSDAEAVARVFGALGDHAVGALCDLTRLAGRLPKLDESLRVDASTSTVSAARSIAWGSAALGIKVPAVYLEEASREAMTAVLAVTPTSVIGTAALRGREVGELAFMSGYHLAGHLPEHRLARLSITVDDLAASFLAATRIVVPDMGVPEKLRALVDLLHGTLKRRLDSETEGALEEAVLAFDEAGGRADLVAYARAVERASLRAGLLLCRDYSLAVDLSAQSTISPLKPEDRVTELATFAATGAYAHLRAYLVGE